jgi:hypothetical protein
MTEGDGAAIRTDFQRVPANMFTFTTTERADLHVAVMHVFGEANGALLPREGLASLSDGLSDRLGQRLLLLGQIRQIGGTRGDRELDALQDPRRDILPERLQRRVLLLSSRCQQLLCGVHLALPLGEPPLRSSLLAQRLLVPVDRTPGLDHLPLPAPATARSP